MSQAVPSYKLLRESQGVGMMDDLDRKIYVGFERNGRKYFPVMAHEFMAEFLKPWGLAEHSCTLLDEGNPTGNKEIWWSGSVFITGFVREPDFMECVGVVRDKVARYFPHWVRVTQLRVQKEPFADN